MTEHNAYREQRKYSMYWLHKAVEEMEALDLIEDIMPSFVQRRYTISSLHKLEAAGSIELYPKDVVKDDVEAADALHADVTKLFDYLLDKRRSADESTHVGQPKRRLAWNGLIQYTFQVYDLPAFEGGLSVVMSGLPAGSACRIVKTVKANRMVQDFEYEMVCDDEEPQGEELEAKAVEETEPGELFVTEVVS